MVPRLCVVSGVFLVGAVLLVSGAARAARSYADRVADVRGGAGPDIVSVTLSNTKTEVTFRVRFAAAPPLRMSRSEKWVDMLLIGIDVPPLGTRPRAPGGEWPGANFALGTHGPSDTGQLVKLGQGAPAESRLVARFRIARHARALTFSIPRRALGNPAWFTFSVAAAREGERETIGGGFDVVPDRGTFRYTLIG